MHRGTQTRPLWYTVHTCVTLWLKNNRTKVFFHAISYLLNLRHPFIWAFEMSLQPYGFRKFIAINNLACNFNCENEVRLV